MRIQIKNLFYLAALNFLFVTVNWAQDNDSFREHINEINTVQVFYKIEYEVDKQCRYEIKNRDVLERLWVSGLDFLKTYGKTVGDNPAFLHQPPLSPNENKEIERLGKDSSDFYFKMEELLKNRHLGQDFDLDKILENIKAAKGTKSLDQVKNLDAEGATALLLAKERFLLTANQIQEKLVYYDLLDEKVELVIDKMIVAKKNEKDVAPYNVQFMAVAELHLDNFREVLHDTKQLSLFLSNCYGKLADDLSKEISAKKIAQMNVVMTGTEDKDKSKSPWNFVKIDNKEFDSILDPQSERYLQKLNSNSSQSDPREKLKQALRKSIASNAELSKGLYGKMASRNGIHKTAHEQKNSKENILENTKTNTASTSAEGPIVAKVTTLQEKQNANSVTAIDTNALAEELKSENHNFKMIIAKNDQYGLNEAQREAYLRSKKDYVPNEDDTLFKIISKAYHRVAFPRFLDDQK